jgi:single-stranded DNA-binding protein
MAIEALVTGNMLENPSQKVVRGRDGETTITTFRMMSDVWTGTAETLQQDEDRSSPVAVTIWNERLGDAVMHLYRKGMRLIVEGDLHLHHFAPTEAEYQQGKEDFWEMRCVAHRISLLPNRVDSIQMRQRQSPAGASAPAEETVAP